MVEWLYYQQGGWLSVLFGNDERQLCGNYAVYYVLSMETGVKCWITVRVEVDFARATHQHNIPFLQSKNTSLTKTGVLQQLPETTIHRLRG